VSRRPSCDIARARGGWDESEIAPVVELDDLREASKDLTPSVSQVEVDRYDRLREQYNSQYNNHTEEEFGTISIGVSAVCRCFMLLYVE
jgi:hypothetical protein